MARIRDPNAIRLLNLGPTAAWRTQAVYHATAELMTADSLDTIVLCLPLTPYLCLGHQEVYDAVLDRAECERRKLVVVRRLLGGCTMYHDANQLSFQCVFHHTRIPAVIEDILAQMLAGPVSALSRLGLKAELRAASEIEVDGKRIASITGGRIGEAFVVVGNLLFDFEYNILTQVWRVPWESFRDLASDTLRERTTTIWRETGPVTIEAVQWILLDEFAKTLGRPIERGTPSQAETRHSRKVAEQLTSPTFLNWPGDDTPAEAMKSLEISAGMYIRAAEVEHDNFHIRATFRTREDVIEAARLDSDPARKWSEVEGELRGVRFKEWQQYL